MIGLGTMGRNFLLNVADHGFSCVGYDLDERKRDLLISEGTGKPVEAADSIGTFVSKLARPRNIMMLVPAGPIVDASLRRGIAPRLPQEARRYVLVRGCIGRVKRRDCAHAHA